MTSRIFKFKDGKKTALDLKAIQSIEAFYMYEPYSSSVWTIEIQLKGATLKVQFSSTEERDVTLTALMERWETYVNEK